MFFMSLDRCSSGQLATLILLIKGPKSRSGGSTSALPPPLWPLHMCPCTGNAPRKDTGLKENPWWSCGGLRGRTFTSWDFYYTVSQAQTALKVNLCGGVAVRVNTDPGGLIKTCHLYLTVEKRPHIQRERERGKVIIIGHYHAVTWGKKIIFNGTIYTCTHKHPSSL